MGRDMPLQAIPLSIRRIIDLKRLRGTSYKIGMKSNTCPLETVTILKVAFKRDFLYDIVRCKSFLQAGAILARH